MTSLAAPIARTCALAPGVLLAVVIAFASRFVSGRYGAPAMLLALLLGIAPNFLSDDERSAPDIAFAARTMLRAGVAPLGVRISLEMVGALGLPVIALVMGAVAATIGSGMAASRLFGFRHRFAFPSAGSVAICGASAALAIAAIPPRDERSEDRLVFTVVGVTVLSTVPMILHPIVVRLLGFDASPPASTSAPRSTTSRRSWARASRSPTRPARRRRS